MASTQLQLKTPVGRIVAGNLYKPNDKNFDGKALLVMSGPNAGQPRVQYFIGLAVPKAPGETHWSQTEWGKQIWALGHTAFPSAATRPDFAWKIEDGDSTIPNKRGRKPVENEGWAGNWIIKLSSGFAPKIYRQENNAWVQELTENYVKPGSYVESTFGVSSNDNQNNPGVYLNLGLVAFRAFGPEISFGPDVNEAGFGAAPLPAGASAVPLASTLPPPAPPIPVTPNPGFLQVPAPGATAASAAPSPGVTAAAPTIPIVPSSPAAPPPPPPAPAARQMTALAQGVTYEAYKAGGWSDEQMIAAGVMTA